MPSPPKPWEVNNASGAVTSPTAASALTTTTAAPSIPERTSATSALDATAPGRPTSKYSTLLFFNLEFNNSTK